MVSLSLTRVPQVAEKRSDLYPLVMVTLVCMLIPVVFEIGGLLMTPLRLLYIFTVPYLIFRWLRGDFGKLLVCDYAIMVFLFWMTLGMGIHHPSSVITFAGSNTLLILGGYLTARGGVRSTKDFMGLARFLALVTVLLLPLGAYEAFYHSDSLILKFLEDLPYIDGYPDRDYCCRFNLTRAQTVFIHPIHFGIFCSLAFSVYFLGLSNHTSFTKRFIVASMIAFASFTSVSSGAVLVIGFQGLLILYALAFYHQPWQWKAATWGAIGIYTVLELFTTKIAFFAMAEKLAFSAHNVYLRQKIYELGTEQIGRTPIFGFGVNRLPLPHYMTGSLDNYWLAIAVMYGLPTLLAALTVFIWPMFKIGSNGFRKGSDLYYARVSWTILMIGLLLSLATVFIWASVQSAVYFMVGSGIFLYYAREPDENTTVEAEQERPRKPVYSRFSGGVKPAPSLARPRPTMARSAAIVPAEN